MEPTPMNRVN